MATLATSPMLPATYDAVWSLVVVAILVALTVALATVMRALKQRTAGDTVGRVQALAALHAAGAISDDEYERRRERLLDRL